MTESDASNRDSEQSVRMTWDDSAKDFVLESFGIEVDDLGRLWDDGQALWSPSGVRVSVDNFAGFVEYHGRLCPITDDFNDLVAAVKERHYHDLHTDNEQSD